MLFKYTVKYYDPDEVCTRKAKGTAYGDTYKEVMQNLVDYYGDAEIEAITVKLEDEVETVWEDSSTKINGVN